MKTWLMKRLLLIIALLVDLLTIAYPQQIRYVRLVSSGTGDGSSWANASHDLQLMINNSNAGDTIWVAEGTYLPIRRINDLHTIVPNDMNNAFFLKADVHIFGGFPNTGTAIWKDRDWDIYPSILSGDIGIVDDSTDNCYMVVFALGDMGTACLDGFTITKGVDTSPAYANITVNGILVDFVCAGIRIMDASPALNNLTVTNNFSDGIVIHGSSVVSAILNNLTVTNNFVTNNFRGGIVISNASPAPVLTNVTVSNNNFGSGIWIMKSSPTLTNVTVSNNFGSGIGIDQGSPVLTNVTISNNQWEGMINYGSSTILTNAIISKNKLGGVYNSQSSSVLTNVTIIDNETVNSGGGIHNVASSTILTNVIITNNTARVAGGGIYNEYSSSLLTNVLIADNKAAYGGGIATRLHFYSDSFMLTNVTICNNMGIGGGIYNSDSDFYFIRNSIIWGNIDSIGSIGNNIFDRYNSGNIFFENSLVGGEPLVNGIILNTDPLFEDTASGDYRLSYCSPAIDAGSNTFYSPDSLPVLSAITIDLDSNPRIYNGMIDLGAYEFQQNRTLGILTYSADTIICFGDTAAITLTFMGGFPWNLIYTTDDGTTYDTIKSISSGQFRWEVIPDTTYKFWAEGNMTCPTPIESVRIKELLRLVFTNSFSNDTLCSGEYTTPIAFLGNVSNFEWTASGDSIDSIPTGVQMGDFGTYLVENRGNTPLTSIITVKPNPMGSVETCTETDTGFSIIVLPEPVLTTVLRNDTLCGSNQTTPVIFTGATTYQWLASGSVSGIPTGTQTGNFGSYTVENKSESNQQSIIRITPSYNFGNKMCSGDISSFYILVYPQTQIQSFTRNKSMFCEDEQLELQVEATGGDLLYRWYLNNKLFASTNNKQYIIPSISRGYSGNYYVEVTGKCGMEKSQTVFVEVSSDKMLVEKWDDVILVDNSMNDYIAYQWYKNNQLIYGSTNQFYQELGGLNGCYSVELTLKNGSRMRSCERCIEKPEEKSFFLYPNPVKQGQTAFIETTEEILYIQLYSIDGKQITKKEYDIKEVQTDMLTQGVYIVVVQTKIRRYNGRIVVY